MRTYWSAHGLAARGHEVHVVTNANEVRPPFRMHMRAEDWKRCEATYGTGSVTVHWSDPIDRSQSYIPMASPFVSKLAAIAAQVHSKHPFDVIFSFYMEPYAIAGFLVAEMSGVPHVVRMAGSDAGRLWHHPQLETLYDHVLRSAQRVVVRGVVAERAIQRGVAAERIVADGGFSVPEELFNPDGPALDLATMRTEVDADSDLSEVLWGELQGGRPYFGVCGKLGERKGSFALLAAMHRLKCAGMDVGLVGLAHGPRAVEDAFRARVRELGLVDFVLQVPFLPHWRVPGFLRGCLAVCCLEQDFPIEFHSPIIPREVLLCGTCLVASTEVIRKLPDHSRLPHGYGCVAIENVNDIGVLSDRLAAILKDPGPAEAVGRRGRAFARELQRDVRFPQMLEQILEAAAARRLSRPAFASVEAGDGRFNLTELAVAKLREEGAARGDKEAWIPPSDAIDLAGAHDVLAALERRITNGCVDLGPLALAVGIEIAVATAENEPWDASSMGRGDPLFRLRTWRWAIDDGDLAGLVPLRDSRVRIVRFDYEVADFLAAQTVAEIPAAPVRRSSYIVAFARSGSEQRSPLHVDGLTARALELCDGMRTAADIANALYREGDIGSIAAALEWMENLFLWGLVWLVDTRDPTLGALGRDTP